ncbi:CBN-ITSN-1 protein [Caenorhabditis brenneri]|uniref:CBN-ITSN-1 protein n=1 Tax=Caenorhabditis brenneri TaxID=135651 RepID=G0MRF6_CAEBE|nr:CBN-ITSN-1 protein [Caenorhabditis brenneri]
MSWEVNDAEYQKNMAMFNQLTAGQPYMDANTARNALMRSNLPTQVLSQIWMLSDLDKDGRLDIREYSIAMRLALNCLAGMPLPAQLPPSLLIVPSRNTPVHHPTMQPTWPGSRQGSVDYSQTLPAGLDRRMSQTQAYPTPPPVNYTTSAPISVAGTPSRHNSISAGSPSTTDRSVFDGRQLDNWAIPHHNKLKYSQLFNALDKDRLGYLSSQVGRSALGLSGLPTNVLAHIWFLSDVNKDGKLSVDEYAISQYMIEMFKSGFALPKATPPELVRMCGISSRSANNTPELEPGAEPPQKSPAPKTFEDKRQDNLSKGQAELERRRRILEEEEQRRRAEVEKKEREEEAKRERERMEKERQAEAERQAQLERQRLYEAQREEEERKKRADMEKQREEEEKLKKVQMEKARVKQMQNQKQQENERLAQRQQREKTLQFQLQALDEKATDVEMDICKAKEAVAVVTGLIEKMRSARDEKVNKIKELQETNQKTAIESQELGHQLLQKQSNHKETTQRKNELELLRKKRDVMRKAIEDAALELSSEKEKTYNQLESLKSKKDKYQTDVSSKLIAKREQYRKIFELYLHARTHATSKIGEFEASRAQTPSSNTPAESIAKPVQVNGFATNFHDAFAEFDKAEDNQMLNSGFGDSSTSDPFAQGQTSVQAAAENPVHSRGAVNQSSFNIHDTHKCRALFAFEARSEDELSFEPGDVIIVFQSHAAEPGWRAGQLREKVGWFPEAFVESIAAVPTPGDQPPIQNMPPNMTPSSSIDEIGAQTARKAEIAAVMETKSKDSQNILPVAPPAPIIAHCVAQFQWRARNDDDLSFAKGDSIEVIEKQDMKWKGRNPAGEVGWFPKSYVKEVGTPVTPVTSPSRPLGPQSGNESAQYDTVPGDKSFVQGAPSELYTVIYDFEAVESTDLALNIGDTIMVLEKNDEWWKGRCNGKEGIFPANYVAKKSPSAETVPEPHALRSSQPVPLAVLCEAKVIVDFTASAPNQLGIKTGETVRIREKSAAGWWEGELIRDGKPIAGWFPGDYVKVIENTLPSLPTNFVHAVALYDYEASQADELSFKTGEAIIITDKTEVEWWNGHTAQNPSKSGLFPSNYVELK